MSLTKWNYQITKICTRDFNEFTIHDNWAFNYGLERLYQCKMYGRKSSGIFTFWIAFTDFYDIEVIWMGTWKMSPKERKFQVLLHFGDILVPQCYLCKHAHTHTHFRDVVNLVFIVYSEFHLQRTCYATSSLLVDSH